MVHSMLANKRACNLNKRNCQTTRLKMVTWILLHGYGFDHHIWEKVRSILPVETFWAPDLPGFGQEPELAEKYDMENLANWLQEKIDGYIQGPYILVGHSMGGYAALAFLSQKPSNCQGLVLLHSHGKADDEFRKAERIKKAVFIENHGSSFFLHQFYPSVFNQNNIPVDFINLQEKYRQNIRSNVLSEYMRGMAERSDFMSLLGSLDIPVLLYHGLHDALIPRGHMEEMSGAIKKGMLILDEKSGHMAMLENPLLVAGAIQFFSNYLSTNASLPTNTSN
jgi:pimeloyl-ACP methyl ester carboxylesterase